MEDGGEGWNRCKFVPQLPAPGCGDACCYVDATRLSKPLRFLTVPSNVGLGNHNLLSLTTIGTEHNYCD
jgi:hypothetical protein